MVFPEHLRYAESHEWVRIDGGDAVVGITEFAQGELGDVVFVDVPAERAVAKGEAFGSIEAVKTVSDLIAPVTGTITAVNPELQGNPELVNSDPYGKGWMVTIRMDRPEEVETMLDASAYAQLVGV